MITVLLLDGGLVAGLLVALFLPDVARWVRARMVRADEEAKA